MAHRFAPVVILAALTAAVLGRGVLAQASGEPSAPGRPNIVLVISDDQHYRDFGFMGHPHIVTPNIDRLAREGMVWTQARVTTSLCCPSLATIISGQYPMRHGITGNTPSPSAKTFDHANRTYVERIEAAPTIPRLLAEAGYMSFQTGKWWHGPARTGGFTDGMTHGDPARGGRHGDAGLRIGREGLEPVSRFVDEALAAERPFFLWYAPFMPHTPHTPPERWRARYAGVAPTESIVRYWAMCSWFDETVGDLRTLLRDRNVEENTVIVFVTDNGWINRRDASRYAPRSKRSPFDGGLRTPLIVHAPGLVAPGQSDGLACSIDIAPTVLRRAGVRPPSSMQGLDLLDAEALAARHALHGAVYSHDAVDYADPEANWEYRWCVTGGWKLLVPNRARFPDRAMSLYRLVDDELETDDRAQAEPAQVESMRRSLERWHASSR